MDATLAELQSARVHPTFEYVARAIELERGVARGPTKKSVSDIGEAFLSLAEMTEHLPEEYRWAIQEVIRLEIHLLLMACMTQAKAIRIIGKTTAGL